MPEVDFMILCDYVRPEGTIMHVIAAGIDRITAPSFPTAHNLGIALRLTLTRSECNYPHQIELIVQGDDGDRVAGFTGTFETGYPEDVPVGWRAYGSIPINLGIPLPKPGVYSVELLIDGNLKKSIPLLALLQAGPSEIRSGDAAHDL
jgi:hypothetical protein